MPNSICLVIPMRMFRTSCAVPAGAVATCHAVTTTRDDYRYPKIASGTAMQSFVSKPPYSYRVEPGVPDFDDRGPVTVMDGECVLCSVGARLIARFDKAGEFRICRSQTTLGGALLRHYGLSPDDPESWLYIVDGQAYTSLDAMTRAGRRIGGVGLLLQPLRLLPRILQD